MFENPRRDRQARNFTTNAPKILDLKSSSEQIFSRKLPLGAPDLPDELTLKEMPQAYDLLKYLFSRLYLYGHLTNLITSIQEFG